MIVCGLEFDSEEREVKKAFLWKHLLKFTQSKGDESTPVGEIVKGEIHLIII